MKASNGFIKLVATAENMAKSLTQQEFTSAHLEYSILTQLSGVVQEVIGEKKYEELVDIVRKEIDSIPKIHPDTVSKYKDMKKDLPIRRSKYVIDIFGFATQLSMRTWLSGEIEVSHLFFSTYVVGKSTASKFSDALNNDQADSIFTALVKREAAEYGIDPSFSQPEDISVNATDEEDNPNTNWKEFVTDLVEASKSYNKPFIGREDIIESTIRTLSRMDKCNPIHVGEPGVGKTAITYGLARKIAEGDVPAKLKDATLYSVDLPGMLAGTRYRGDFEQRLKALLDGVQKDKMPILFFDEIHMIIGAGSGSDRGVDAANIIKPYLTEGKIRFIGATTYDEYRLCVEKDKALERRFHKLDVAEPSVDDAITILKGLAPAYGKYHNVTYLKSAVEAAVKLSQKYINDRFLPDKAIDLIDLSGAQYSVHPELGKKIDDKSIENIMLTICKIPVIAEGDELKPVKTLEKRLKAKIFGQDEAISDLSDLIKLSKSGLGDDNKPIASLLFVGPTGVGKTELAKQLASNLNIDFVRFDMSEYQEKHAVSKLIGSPAGYVGYEDGGLITEAVRKTPHCVLLLDEIEKAHQDIFKSFLQVMDYGVLTDNKGRKADFRNCIIIMTSNAGATDVERKALGFVETKKGSSPSIEKYERAVNELFAPEFRNRLTKILVFNGINDEIGKMIARKELNILSSKLKAKRNIVVTFTDACINRLVESGVTKEYGARGIQRAVNENITKLFVNAIIGGTASSNCTVDYDGTKFVIKKTQQKKSLFPINM